MKVLTEWRSPLEGFGLLRPERANSRPGAHPSPRSSVLFRRPFVFLSIGFALVAAHLLVVVLRPPGADCFLYAIIGLAILFCASIAYLHTRSAKGALSLRWNLFALALAVHGINYIRAAVDTFIGTPLSSIDVVLQAAAGTLVILALTLPSGSRSAGERSLDIAVALFFCVLRIVYLHPLVSPHANALATLTRFTFESGIGLLLGIIALRAASAVELPFFRSIVIYLAAVLVSCVCTDQIGFLWLHQQEASPWSLTGTALRIGAAAYLLQGLAEPAPLQRRNPHKAILRSLMPFAMSCLLVWLSMTLLPVHSKLGQLGIAVGVASFLIRSGLAAARREHERTTVNNILRPPTIPTGDSPLNSMENRIGFRLALARARRAAAPDSPLSLILIGVEDALESADNSASDHDDDHLIAVARNLSQWNVSGSTLCYMGNGRFAMLLPSTNFDIARAIAIQMCISLESLQASDSGNLMTVCPGVAAASRTQEVSDLLGIATDALVRAQIRRNGRRRVLSSSAGLSFDC
jgi:GGDEF domain-containing protein